VDVASELLYFVFWDAVCGRFFSWVSWLGLGRCFLLLLLLVLDPLCGLLLLFELEEMGIFDLADTLGASIVLRHGDADAQIPSIVTINVTLEISIVVKSACFLIQNRLLLLFRLHGKAV
jgi:hypothetical protein